MTDDAPGAGLSVTRLSVKEAEDEAARYLALELAPRIDALSARVDRPDAASVPARSSLAGDDRAADPFQISHAAWHGITHAAADNLQDLRRLTGLAPGRWTRGYAAC